MPVKLSVGLQQKVGLPDYGSLGASCFLEFEIERSCIEGDPDGFQHQVRTAFAACRQSVSEQLAMPATKPPPAANGQSHVAVNGYANGHPSGVHTFPAKGTATDSQVRAIYAIARRHGLDPENLATQRFHRERLEDLSVREASALIDELKRVAREGH